MDVEVHDVGGDVRLRAPHGIKDLLPGHVPAVLAEYYRALGRIGTPDAVAALVKAAQESGGLLSRKPVGPRLAAIEALGTAGGGNAVTLLREPARHRSADVRAAAAAALERATATAG